MNLVSSLHIFTSNIDFRLTLLNLGSQFKLNDSSHKFKPFPFAGEAKITGKINSLELPVERQDDAVLNNIEGLNDGLFHSVLSFDTCFQNPLINRKLRGHPP